MVAFDLVGLVGKGCQHDNGNVFCRFGLLELLHYFVAVCIGQHHIADNERGLQCQAAFIAGFSIHEPLGVEINAHFMPDLLHHVEIIFDNSNSDIIQCTGKNFADKVIYRLGIPVFYKLPTYGLFVFFGAVDGLSVGQGDGETTSTYVIYLPISDTSMM